jgi:recombination protein RecA
MASEDVATLVAQLNKQLSKDGKPLIMTASAMVVPKTFTSGLLSLDVCLGGGWPGNQWVEVYGKESNGKTSIILRTIAANQAINPDFTTFWVASEHYDTEWAAKNGIDNDRVHVIPTSNMELAYEMIIQAAKSHQFDCIVLDSYPALSASEEEDKSMDQNTMTLGARRTGQFFRKIGGLYSADRPYIGFFINQLRDAVGSFSPYGTPTTTPGGKAKNYAFYQRVLVSRDDWIEEKVDGQGKVKVGQTNKYLMEKNKAAAPKAVAMGDFYFMDSEKGFHPGQFDLVKDVITMAVLFKVVKRAGAWFSYESELTGESFRWQGRDPMVEEIRANIELQAEITKVTLEIATQ